MYKSVSHRSRIDALHQSAFCTGRALQCVQQDLGTFQLPEMCVPAHGAMRQCSGLGNSPSRAARKQTMKQKSSETPVVRLESHCSSVAVNHCVLMKYFFPIAAFQWGLLVYRGSINSSVQAVLHWEDINERDIGAVPVNSISLCFDLIWWMNRNRLFVFLRNKIIVSEVARCVAGWALAIAQTGTQGKMFLWSVSDLIDRFWNCP